MKIELIDVSQGEGTAALPPTTLTYESSAVTLTPCETAQRPTLLALIASGRMRPTSGTVTRLPETTAGALRASVAVVDAPDISEPGAELKLLGIVQEELMFAERPSSQRTARAVLDELDVADYVDSAIEELPVAVRLRVLAELAARRPGVEAIILTSPDRHGGDPLEWYPVAEDLASRGLAVLVIAGAASIAVIEAAYDEADAVADDDGAGSGSDDDGADDAQSAERAPAERTEESGIEPTVLVPVNDFDEIALREYLAETPPIELLLLEEPPPARDETKPSTETEEGIA